MEAARAEGLRSKLGALALVIAPGIIVLGVLVEPTVDFDDRAAVLDVVAESTARWNLAQAVWFIGMLLLIPAAITAARYFRRQRPGMSLVATILAPLTPILISGFVMFGMVDEAFVDQAADREEMVALAERIEEVTLFPLLFGLLIVGMLGMLVLAIGLWRSKVVPVWVPALIVVGFLLAFFGPGDNKAVALVANVILWVGFGTIGAQILSEQRSPGAAREAPAPT